jgi:hypothetical protein
LRDLRPDISAVVALASELSHEAHLDVGEPAAGGDQIDPLDARDGCVGRGGSACQYIDEVDDEESCLES